MVLDVYAERNLIQLHFWDTELESLIIGQNWRVKHEWWFPFGMPLSLVHEVNTDLWV